MVMANLFFIYSFSRLHITFPHLRRRRSRCVPASASLLLNFRDQGRLCRPLRKCIVICCRDFFVLPNLISSFFIILFNLYSLVHLFMFRLYSVDSHLWIVVFFELLIFELSLFSYISLFVLSLFYSSFTCLSRLYTNIPLPLIIGNG